MVDIKASLWQKGCMTIACVMLFTALTAVVLASRESSNSSAKDGIKMQTHLQNASTGYEVVWITFCAPPGCTDNHPAIIHLRRTSPIPIRILNEIEGRKVQFAKRNGNGVMDMTEKLGMLTDYITKDPEGIKWEHVIVSDATDVIANPGTANDVVRAYKTLVGHEDKVLVSTEASCWINSICTHDFMDHLMTKFADHFAPRSHTDAGQDVFKFPCAGQHMSSRSALVHLLNFTNTIQAMHRTGKEIPVPVPKEWFPVPWGDQGVLALYWMEYPERVAMDQDAVLFGTTKRFFKMIKDDGSSRRRWDGGCRADSKQKLKLFMHGWGWSCLASDIMYKFQWRRDELGAVWMVLDHDEKEFRPLLGWHANSHTSKAVAIYAFRRYDREVNGVVINKLV